MKKKRWVCNVEESIGSLMIKEKLSVSDIHFIKGLIENKMLHPSHIYILLHRPQWEIYIHRNGEIQLGWGQDEDLCYKDGAIDSNISIAIREHYPDQWAEKATELFHKSLNKVMKR